MSGFILFFVIAAVIAFVVFSIYQSAKRRQDLSQWATMRGFSFAAGNDSSLDNQHPSFSCLTRGSSRYAYNVMQGTQQNRSICAFDYHYVTHSTDSDGHGQSNHRQFSAVIVTPGLPLKPLVIRSETFFDKIGGLLGFHDIEFESAEFNRAFHVTSPDRRWAFDVLNQQSMEFLLGSPRFSLQFDERCVIAYNDRVFSTEIFDTALGVVCGLLDRLPESVVKELKGTNA